MTKKLVTLAVAASILAGCIGKKGEDNKAEFDPDVYPATTVGITVSADGTDFFYQETNSEFRKIAEKNKQTEVILEFANDNAEKQKDQIKEFINRGAVKGILIHLVSGLEKERQDLMNLVCNAKIPTVFYERTPGNKLLAKCSTTYFVGSDDLRVGSEQGLQVLEGFKNHPEWDKNSDDLIQYGIITAPEHTSIGEFRTSWAIRTIENYPNIGRKTEKLFGGVGNFSREASKKMVQEWMNDPRFEEVEVIIANTDIMALGAIDALKEKGLKIPVVGADGSPEGLEAVKNGSLYATIATDYSETAKLAMRVVTNLATGLPADDNIDYHIQHEKLLVPVYKAYNADKR